MKRFLALLVSTLLPASAVSPVPQEDLFRLGYAPPEIAYAHRDALGLSPEQQERLATVFDTSRFEMSDLESAVTQRGRELEAIVSSGTPSAEEAEASLNRLLEAEAAVKRLQLRTILGVNALLSREQRDQAIALAQREAACEAEFDAKSEKFRAAFESLGIKPTPALEERAQAITRLADEGKFEAALAALEAAAAETGIHDPGAVDPVDFTRFEAGDTDLDALRRRYEAVERRVERVYQITQLRQLVQARDGLEAAKAAEDAVAAGRILTWAEGILP